MKALTQSSPTPPSGSNLPYHTHTQSKTNTQHTRTSNTHTADFDNLQALHRFVLVGHANHGSDCTTTTQQCAVHTTQHNNNTKHTPSDAVFFSSISECATWLFQANLNERNSAHTSSIEALQKRGEDLGVSMYALDDCRIPDSSCHFYVFCNEQDGVSNSQQKNLLQHTNWRNSLTMADAHIMI